MVSKSIPYYKKMIYWITLSRKRNHHQPQRTFTAPKTYSQRQVVSVNKNAS